VLLCLNALQIRILDEISADATFIGICVLLAGFIAHGESAGR